MISSRPNSWLRLIRFEVSFDYYWTVGFGMFVNIQTLRLITCSPIIGLMMEGGHFLKLYIILSV